MGLPEPKPGQVYRHFKGGIYEVVCVAQHTERKKEKLVIYKPVVGSGFYARPLDIFLDLVVVPGESTGQYIPRFTLITEEDENVQNSRH